MRRTPLLVVLIFAGCRFDDAGVSLTADDVAVDAGGEDDAGPDIDAEVAPDAEPPDVDTDGDGVVDDVDNCVAIPNTPQSNEDGDLYGDSCDNCAHVDNDDQVSADGDTVGDACDPRPGLAGDVQLIFDGFNGATRSSIWAVGAGGDSWTTSGGVMHQGSTLREQKILYTTGFSADNVTIDTAFTPTDIPASTDTTTDRERVAGVVGGYAPGAGAGTGRVAHVGDIITSADYPVWIEVGTVTDTGNAGSNEFAYGNQVMSTGRYTLRGRVANGRQSVLATEPNGTATTADDFDASAAGAIGLRTRNVAVDFEYVIVFGVTP